MAAQASDEEALETRGRAGEGLLAGIAEEAVSTDDWWGQPGDRSIEDQLLSDLRKNGAPVCADAIDHVHAMRLRVCWNAASWNRRAFARADELCAPTCAAAEASCKTAFVLSLLAELIAEGHRTLIFSQSRVMLDILQAAIAQRGWAFLRIDGTVVSSAQRAVSNSACGAWELLQMLIAADSTLQV